MVLGQRHPDCCHRHPGSCPWAVIVARSRPGRGLARRGRVVLASPGCGPGPRAREGPQRHNRGRGLARSRPRELTTPMRGALYLWRGTGRRTWRTVLALAVIGGLLGAVALAALAGARRTAGAYDRYLRASLASDALVNVPGLLPGVPALEPSQRISRLPAVESAATYIGLSALPVVGGRVRSAFLTNGLDGSLGEYFSQDKLTVL